VIASYLRAVTGSYAPAFMTTVLLALVGLVVVFLTYRVPTARLREAAVVRI